jgi:hypothetical protein
VSSFPGITRPCPYKDRLSEVMDGDFCRMCKKTVTDLSVMSEGERDAFLRSCAGEEACVSYKVPVHALLGAAAAVSMSFAPLVSAADTPNPPQPAAAAPSASAQPAEAPATSSPAANENYATEVGGFSIVEIPRTRRDPRSFPEPLEMHAAGIPTDNG